VFGHSITVIGLLRNSYAQIGFALHFVTAIALSFIPLFDILGFERAFVSAIISGPIAAIIGAAAIHKQKEDPRRSLITTFGVCIQLNLLFLIPSLLSGLITEWLTQACNPQEGFLLVITLAGSTIVFGSALGIVIGRVFSTPKKANIAIGGIFLCAFFMALIRLYQQPQIFAFSMPFGYWPGSLYDEEVKLTQALLVHRLITIMVAMTIVFGLDSIAQRRQSVSRISSLRIQRLLLALACGSCAYYLWGKGETLGFDLNRSSIDRVLSQHVNNEHFELRVDPAISKKNLSTLLAEHELHYQQLAEFFEDTPDKPIRVYVYRGVEQKRFLMGAHHTQIARPWAHEIHVHGFDVPHRVLKHELAHVFAAKFAQGLFKVPASKLIFVNMGIVEGTAVAADWRADQMTVHEWARAMRAQNKAPDPRTILYPQGFWAISASRAYTIAGSFLRFLIDTHGIEPFKKLYKSNSFQSAYGHSLDQLVGEWEVFIDKTPLSDRAVKLAEHRFTRPGIFGKVCAHETAKLASEGYRAIQQGDYDLGIERLEEVQRNRPHSAANFIFIANALAKDQQFERAHGFLARATGLPQISQQSRTQVGLALADLQWQTGNSTAARAKYRSTDIRHLPVSQRRLVSAKIVSTEKPKQIQDSLRPFLLRELSHPEGLIRLSELAHQGPEDALVRYLFARQLEQLGLCVRGLQETKTALTGNLPSPDFYKEAVLMKGRMTLCTGQYKEAQAHFQRLVDSSTRAVDQLMAQEWKMRARIRSESPMILE
jgi:tetratricopeptide (TPR) repeat protein